MLLPLTLFLNWRLALVLIVLVVRVRHASPPIVIRRTEAAQRRVEDCNSSLAGTAQDALANVMVVQSFTRLSAEARMFGDIAEQVIRHQFPVLNWWALVNVLTRGVEHAGGDHDRRRSAPGCTCTARPASARSSASWASPCC